MGKICDSINRILVANGGEKVDGSKGECVRALIYQLEGVTIPSSKESLGDILEYWADLEEGIAKTSFVCKSGSTDVTPTSITLKKGSTVGSGDAVDVDTDGTYHLVQGSYNYSIVAEGYVTKTGTFDVSASDVKAGTKSVSVELVASQQ